MKAGIAFTTMLLMSPAAACTNWNAVAQLDALVAIHDAAIEAQETKFWGMMADTCIALARSKVIIDPSLDRNKLQDDCLAEDRRSEAWAEALSRAEEKRQHEEKMIGDLAAARADTCKDGKR